MIWYVAIIKYRIYGDPDNKLYRIDHLFLAENKKDAKKQIIQFIKENYSPENGYFNQKYNFTELIK